MIAFMIIHFFILTFETIKSNQYKVLTELLAGFVWSDYGGQKFIESWHDFPADKVVQGSAAASLTDKVRMPITLISYRSFAKPPTFGDFLQVRKEVTWVGWPQWHLRPPVYDAHISAMVLEERRSTWALENFTGELVCSSRSR